MVSVDDFCSDMVRRHGEVEVYISTLVGSILGAFFEVFFERSVCSILGAVKLKQSFRKLAVIKPLFAD